MNTFALVISSPDGEVYSGDVLKITLRGAEGDLAIMAGHIPFVTSVKPCDLRIELSDGEVKTGKTGGGLLTVAPEKVTFLSGSFSWK